MNVPDHVYLKKKIRALGSECTSEEYKVATMSSSGKCVMCGRESGDKYTFGPTKYVKSKLSFRVKIHGHVIKSEGSRHTIAMCCGCHLSYHLFNRLDPEADFGGLGIGEVARCKTEKKKVIKIRSYHRKAKKVKRVRRLVVKTSNKNS